MQSSDHTAEQEDFVAQVGPLIALTRRTGRCLIAFSDWFHLVD